MNRSLIICSLLGAIAAASPAGAQVGKAEKALRKGEHDEAISYVEQALRKNPGDAKAFELLGRIFDAHLGELQGGDRFAVLRRLVKSYERIIDADPGLRETVEDSVFARYAGEFQKGEQAAADGGYRNAAQFFEGSTILQPDSAQAYANWAFALIGDGAEVEAIKPLEIALEKGEPDDEIYTYLGRFYLRHDRVESAVQLLEKATREFTANGGLLDLLLNAYAASGQADRSVALYRKIVAEAPDHKVYRFNYGSLLLKAGEYDEAIVQLKEAVRIDENYADAQYNLGSAYVNSAIAVNDRNNELVADLRAKKESLSLEELTERGDAIKVLAAKRTELFALAIEPLERARSLREASGGDTSTICQVLLQSYQQTDQADRAQTVQECAGY